MGHSIRHIPPGLLQDGLSVINLVKRSDNFSHTGKSQHKSCQIDIFHIIHSRFPRTGLHADFHIDKGIADHA